MKVPMNTQRKPVVNHVPGLIGTHHIISVSEVRRDAA
jgi:hypothetical protein